MGLIHPNMDPLNTTFSVLRCWQKPDWLRANQCSPNQLTEHGDLGVEPELSQRRECARLLDIKSGQRRQRRTFRLPRSATKLLSSSNLRLKESPTPPSSILVPSLPGCRHWISAHAPLSSSRILVYDFQLPAVRRACSVIPQRVQSCTV